MLQFTAAALLLLFIQCQAQDVKVQENFDPVGFSGDWFGLLAVSNCPMFQKMKKDMTRPIIKYTWDGYNMKTSVAFKSDKGCQQMDANLVTVANGHYKHDSAQGNTEIIITGADKSFAMEYRKMVHEGSPCTTLNLLGKNDKMPDEVKNRFVGYMHQLGQKDEDLKVFQNGGMENGRMQGLNWKMYGR
ncbi:olfactory protein-like [Leptodactylus fuscus]|uniref:olfactory protein-like n=1 Tax=Leptodactylus fuscus TaxID=238119 RepID=UPI003F4EEC92